MFKKKKQTNKSKQTKKTLQFQNEKPQNKTHNFFS